MSASEWLSFEGGPPPVRGTVRVCVLDGGADPTEEPGVHTSVFVRGPSYEGMEDNDIRGFLDGGFQWAFNQVGQTHVRLGRNAAEPRHLRYGVPEVFRVLQRWDGIRLPEGSTVVRCRLRLHVEFTSDVAQRVYLYAAHKDWEPGSGGVDGNNVSVPNPGEVWWNEAGFGRQEWGLPGAGYAADAEPDSDTEAMPLAECLLEPGAPLVEFDSGALAHYAGRRLKGGKPLLFLLKLSDAGEDTPGSLMGLYSASDGDSLSLARRPSLHIEWTHPACRVAHERSVLVEHGRTLKLPGVAAAEGALVSVEFDPGPDSEVPTIERVSPGDGGSLAWRQVQGPLVADSDRVLLRLAALRNPVALGAQLEANFSDTWILTAPPEEQDVHWEFRSPSGVSHVSHGVYEGRYLWSLGFRPDEVGRWQCRLIHALAGTPYAGPIHVFDVVVDGLEPAVEALQSLTSRVAEARAEERPLEVLRRQYTQLQRGWIRGQTPGSFRGPNGLEFREDLRRARSAFWGKEVPAEPPFESYRLYSEHDGVPLQDPIPYTEHVSGSNPSPPGLLRRFRRLLGRQRRRISAMLDRRHQEPGVKT